MKIIKQLFFLTLTGTLVFSTSCIDDEPQPTDYQSILDDFINEIDADRLASDIQSIDTYLEENSITAEKHPSGLRYVISQEGSGRNPSLDKTLEVNYQGSLLTTGEVFDQGENVQFPLYALVASWQVGLPLIKEGGSMTLYAPSGLCYGERAIASAGIPANANMIFTLDLIEIVD